MTYQKLRELLIEQTGWNIEPIDKIIFQFIPELKIKWNYNIESEKNDKRLITYHISFENNDESNKIRALIIKKIDNFQDPSIKIRKFYIDETYNLDTLVHRIKEEIPFEKADSIPRIFY